MSIYKVTPEKAREMIRGQEAVLLDVRQPEEYLEGHIPGARLCPLPELEQRASEQFKDKTQPFIIYCRSGRRSILAAQKLEQLGYEVLYDLGGILDWPYTVVTLTDEVILEMSAFDHGDAKRIQHFMKVYEFSRMIAACECIDRKTCDILMVASVMHDIGIRPSLEKYGDAIGPHQEELGPDYARPMLEKFEGLSEAFIDRVCYLIGHHHTYTNVDGDDYQILIEADFLVNSMEGEMDRETIRSMMERIFRTKTGIRLLKTEHDL